MEIKAASLQPPAQKPSGCQSRQVSWARAYLLPEQERGLGAEQRTGNPASRFSASSKPSTVPSLPLFGEMHPLPEPPCPLHSQAGKWGEGAADGATWPLHWGSRHCGHPMPLHPDWRARAKLQSSSTRTDPSSNPCHHARPSRSRRVLTSRGLLQPWRWRVDMSQPRRVPARWPLPGPQAPLSALPRAGNRRGRGAAGPGSEPQWAAPGDRSVVERIPALCQ